MKKLLTYLLFVLLGVGLVDGLFSLFIDKNIKVFDTSPLAKTYNSVDIAIFGGSRAIHHYNPQVIKDSLKCSVHVFGEGAQNIYYHYALLNALINNAKAKPQIVILELSAIDVYDTPKWNTERLNRLFPYYYSESSVRNVLSEVLDKEVLCVVRSSGLYRHNSQTLSYLINTCFNTHNSKDEGFIPLKNIWKKSLESENEDGERIDNTKVKYIEKFVDLCKQQNISLFFTVSPNYKLLDAQNWKKVLKAIAQNHNISFLDHEQDYLFLEHPEWFNEPFHLNETGAAIYSQIIAGDLKRIESRR